jgi:hypothetical protein
LNNSNYYYKMDKIKVLNRDVNNIINEYLLQSINITRNNKKICLKQLKSRTFHIKYSLDKHFNDRLSFKYLRLKKFSSGWTYVQN